MTMVPASPAAEAGSLAPAEAAAAARYRRSADAAETLRGYRRDWQAFSAWCADRHASALPAAPATVGAHLAALADAGRALATLRRRLAAIARAHRSAGHRLDAGHPAIRETLRGIARSIGRPQRRAAALCTAELKAIAAACAPPGEGDVASLAALRDRALLLFGYAAALRRGELAALQVEHLAFSPTGARLLLPRSKADVAGAGEAIFVARGATPATCPVAALEAWLRAARLGNGPVWRAINRSCQQGGAAPPRIAALGRTDPARGLSGEAIRLILRRRAAAAGVTGTALEPISPHGLRAGFVTEAYRAGVPDEAIMGHTRHRDLASMRRYVRRARLEADTPTRRLGL
ncbi:tyrosine-type recombinase/integrase [Dankookia sp. GCM10030260]|uniref:tyrosine-type recombinase/integrase n=1 Tax=Dankookia sp. GCM10030260 TaxID=3273390 RepID=UPI003614A5A5